MKEGQFNNYSQENINAAENLYFANIQHDKDLVWERIEERLKRKKITPLWFYYAAASILILICIGTIFKFKLDGKNEEIAALKDISNIQHTNNQSNQIVECIEWKTDTVKIVNEKIVGIPDKTIDTLVVHDTITNFLVKNDTIYINRSEKKAERNFLVQENMTDNQSIEPNSISKKKSEIKDLFFNLENHIQKILILSHKA